MTMPQWESPESRRLERVEKRIEELKAKHHGRESELTYHAGWELGYLGGKRAILEDFT